MIRGKRWESAKKGVKPIRNPGDVSGAHTMHWGTISTHHTKKKGVAMAAALADTDAPIYIGYS